MGIHPEYYLFGRAVVLVVSHRLGHAGHGRLSPVATGMDGRRRAGVSGQNCDGALLTARPLSGHAHPVRRQQAPPQATADRSEPRHISQLHCGSDHDLKRHAGDPHSQTTTKGRHTPILTVALRRRVSPPWFKAARRAPRTPRITMTNRALKDLLSGFCVGRWISPVGRSLNATVPLIVTDNQPELRSQT
jgi:hypothetical protein